MAATVDCTWVVVGVLMGIRPLLLSEAITAEATASTFLMITNKVWFCASNLAACAWVAVLLLLWHELTSLAGSPWALATVLASAATWGYGTQRMRRTVLTVPTVTAAFWMLTLSTPLMTLLAWFLESSRWHWPSDITWGVILYNTFGVFVFAQTGWLVLARGLPPVASTLSVMFIPILGVFSSSYFLGEVLHAQDYGAVALIVVAIALVLWPTPAPKAPSQAAR